jgi:hypothetical protein
MSIILSPGATVLSKYKVFTTLTPGWTTPRTTPRMRLVERSSSSAMLLTGERCHGNNQKVGREHTSVVYL